MGAIVGIDLGTTNTVVAAMRDGMPVAIKDEIGSSVIPSIVSFLPSGAVLVGDAAKERRNDDPRNTVYSVKRLIGRPWDSPEVTQARQRFSFALKEGPGRATFVVARNETFTLPEISAYVLRKAKSIAELELGESVDRAIITVPANFNDLQRAATKVAGRVAGLDVLRIINEPTAAALAYGYGQGNSEKIAVFDFGGGTFDITLLSLTQNVFEVLATAGDTFLGGDDLDWAIVQKMADAAKAQLGRNVDDDPVAIEHLRTAAETLKMRLSTSNQEELRIELAPPGANSTRPLVFAMSRAEFEQLATPIIERTLDVCKEALRIARLDIKALDHVIAVGGCTRIPLVQQRAEEFFARPLQADLDPHEVVAMGAALQGYALTAPMTTAKLDVPPPPQVSHELSEHAAADRQRRKTHPFERMGTTNVGVGQALGPDKFESIQVPSPNGTPSGRAPNTQNLVSRGRLNTAIGIGSDSSLADNLDWDPPEPPKAVPAKERLDAESLLPVVTGPSAKKQSQAVFRAPEFTADPGSLRDPDDDEATMVRPPIALGPRSDAELPGLTDSPPNTIALHSKEPVHAHTNARDTLADTAILPSIGTAHLTAEDELDHAEGDLPAVSTPDLQVGTATRGVPGAPDTENRRLSKPPTTDELRQRYGDLPLIIGGKRLSSTPSSRAAPMQDLPLVRPVFDTVEDATPLPQVLERAQPSPKTRAPAPTIADSELNAELPLVGVGIRPASEKAEEVPRVAPPRKPAPPRAAPTRTQPIAPAKTGPNDTLFALKESDVEEETRGQPPSAGRISIRPGMRLEPGEEASLPLPNLPAQNPAPLSVATAQSAPNRAVTQQNANENRKPPVQNPVKNQAVAGSATEPIATLPAGAPLRPGYDVKAAGRAGLGSLFDDAANARGAPAIAAEGRNQTLIGQPPPLVPATAPAVKPFREAGAPSSSVAAYSIAVPLLIDVTPLSLSVETVGAYCDVLIDRNTPVPCERSREFVTVQDGQQTVRVRVAQGESRVFSENLLLGELELTGLRPAPRGQLRISVTFGLDSDGLLHVRAIDLDTGRATTSELRLAGIPSPTEISQMANRQFPNA
jgi:molecular chaperone DnaK